MSEMTSRTRVEMAVRHHQPDRVPLDIGGGYSTTIVVEGYDRLKQTLGLETPTRIMNTAFRLAYLDEAALRRLGSDCRPLGTAHHLAPAADPDAFTDEFGVGWRKVHFAGGFYYELAHHPLAEATLADLDRYRWPDPLDPAHTAGLADRARDLYENSPYAIMADAGFKSFFELAYSLRGFEQFLVDLAENPEFVTALMERILALNLAGTRRFLDAVGQYITVFRLADDLAAQSGPLMAPATYRRLIKPYHAQYTRFVKEHTDAAIFYHSCGRINALLDDLIEVGVEIINPVQVSAMGDMVAVKQRWGDRLTFWGGIDTQRVLPYGTPAAVTAEVQQRIRELASGGGYVVGPVHNIQADVPPENILAMADAVHAHGRYPLREAG